MATVAELGQKVKAKYPGQYDDMPDVLLGQKIKLKFPGQYDDFSDTPADRVAAIKARMPALRQQAQQAQQEAQKLNDPGQQIGQAAHGAGVWGARQLPAVGAAVGMAAGAVPGALTALPTGGLSVPVAMSGGGMLGAAGGEALSQLALRALGEGGPSTPQEALGRMNTAATIQGAFEAVPKVALEGAQNTGKAFMQSAMGKRALTGADAALVALRERVAPTRAGLAEVVKRLGVGGRVRNSLLEVADKSGNKMPIDDLIAGTTELENHLHQTADVTRYRANAMGTGFTPNPEHPAEQLLARNDALKEAFPKGIKPSQLMDKIREWDKAAKPVYDALANKKTAASITPAQMQEAGWKKALADRGREWLRDLPDVGTRLEETNGHLSDLIQLKQAIISPAKKEMSSGAMLAGRLLPAAAGGIAGAAFPGSTTQRVERGALGAAGGFAAGAGAQQMGTPAMLAQMALALHNPQLAALLQSPMFSQMLSAPAQNFAASRR